MIAFINELYDAKYSNMKMKLQNLVDMLHSVNYHRNKVSEIALFDSFLSEDYECLILIFFLLLRSKTEITLNVKFYKNDKSMIGRPNVDPTLIYLEKRDAFKILNLTFEEQVNSLKIESSEILSL